MTDPHKPAAAKPPEVGQARHAESKEEVEALMKVETAKIPPAGSRNYVAGQPVDEEEQSKTEEEANKLAEHGKQLREKEEKEIAERVKANAEHNPMKDEPLKAPRPDTTVPADAAKNASKK